MLRAQVPVILLGVVTKYIELDIEAPPKAVTLYELDPLGQKGPAYTLQVQKLVSLPEKDLVRVYIGDKSTESQKRAVQVAPGVLKAPKKE